jgi:hypothetical protein
MHLENSAVEPPHQPPTDIGRRAAVRRFRAELGDVSSDALDTPMGWSVPERMDALFDAIADWRANPTATNARALDRAVIVAAFGWRYAHRMMLIADELCAELHAAPVLAGVV